MIKQICAETCSQGPNATERLEDSGRQNDGKMSRKTGNAQSRATFFRHSAVLSLPAVLLRKVPVIYKCHPKREIREDVINFFCIPSNWSLSLFKVIQFCFRCWTEFLVVQYYNFV